MQIGTYTLDKKRPALMGVVNRTPDSFSDGGRFPDAASAVDHALRMIDEGADIIDVGGESSRPGAEPVPEEEELGRVIPVIEGIRRRSTAPISIDTTKASVAKRALDAGADMVNDISAGRFDLRVLGVAAEAEVPLCLMHMQGTPGTMQKDPRYDDLMGEIGAFLEDAVGRAVRAGVAREKIVIDPGIGFGKSAEENVEILKQLRTFERLGRPILVGTSRKSFIGKLLGLDVSNRLEATLATFAIAVEGGASILRVHDAGASRRFLDMYLLCRAS